MLFHPFNRETFLEFEVEHMHEHKFHQLLPRNPNYNQYKLHSFYIFIHIKKRKMKAFKTYLEIGAKLVAIPYL